MSTIPGLSNKVDKNKAKFKTIEINKLYKGNTVEAQRSIASARHGLQVLGKVGSSRRMPPPAHLPSLKSEGGGSDSTVNLVPSGGSGWGSGSKEEEKIAIQQPSLQPQLGLHQSQTASQKQVTQVEGQINISSQGNSVSSGQLWSSITSGLKSGRSGNPKLPYFQEEFPELASGIEEKTSSSKKEEENKEAQYGPGPSLRPQNVASWREGGGRKQQLQQETECSSPTPPPSSVPHQTSSDEDDEIPPSAYHPPPAYPAAMPRMLRPVVGPPPRMGPGPMMYGPPMMPPFMFPPRPGFAPPVFNPNFMPPPYFHPDHRFRGMVPPKMQYEGQERNAIIKDMALKEFDKIESSDGGWAGADIEIDYSTKLVFSDEEDSFSAVKTDKRDKLPRDNKFKRELSSSNRGNDGKPLESDVSDNRRERLRHDSFDRNRKRPMNSDKIQYQEQRHYNQTPDKQRHQLRNRDDLMHHRPTESSRNMNDGDEDWRPKYRSVGDDRKEDDNYKILHRKNETKADRERSLSESSDMEKNVENQQTLNKSKLANRNRKLDDNNPSSPSFQSSSPESLKMHLMSRPGMPTHPPWPAYGPHGWNPTAMQHPARYLSRDQWMANQMHIDMQQQGWDKHNMSMIRPCFYTPVVDHFDNNEHYLDNDTKDEIKEDTKHQSKNKDSYKSQCDDYDEDKISETFYKSSDQKDGNTKEDTDDERYSEKQNENQEEKYELDKKLNHKASVDKGDVSQKDDVKHIVDDKRDISPSSASTTSFLKGSNGKNISAGHEKLTKRRSDSRPACPPPIPLQRTKQNVPTHSNYIALKKTRSSNNTAANSDTNSTIASKSEIKPVSSEQSTQILENGKIDCSKKTTYKDDLLDDEDESSENKQSFFVEESPKKQNWGDVVEDDIKKEEELEKDRLAKEKEIRHNKERKENRVQEKRVDLNKQNERYDERPPTKKKKVPTATLR